MSSAYATLRLLLRRRGGGLVSLHRAASSTPSSTTGQEKKIELKTGDRIKRMLSAKEANRTRDGFNVEAEERHGLGDFHTPHPGFYPPTSGHEQAEEAEELEHRYHIPNYETEEFSFDPEKGILREESDEKQFFEQVVYPHTEHLPFRTLRAKAENAAKSRKFETSSSREEWQFVERLMAPKVVRTQFDYKVYPSGFVPPDTARSKRNAECEYFVGRTIHMMMPVYTVYERRFELVITKVNRCEGNLYKLRDDLRDFLLARYEQDFMSQVSEVQGRIVFRGDFETDFKQFLLEKGF